ncbi:uncharacterized protein [Anabrus simplex]|uniref:uncharacterized protein isoform X2 n=1 Tax=Anabrus simplex TaxID=316456 RepID=UPI0034DD58C0
MDVHRYYVFLGLQPGSQLLKFLRLAADQFINSTFCVVQQHFVFTENRLNRSHKRLRKMKQLHHSCCFCCSLKVGAIIVAVLHMLVSGLMLLVDGLVLDNFDHHFEETHRKISDGDVLAYNLQKMMRIVDTVMQVFLFISSVMLLLAALWAKPKLVVSWVVVESICYSVYVAESIVCYIFGLEVSFAEVALISVVSVYCLAAMVRFYQQLKEVHQHRMMNSDSKVPLEPYFERI